MNLDMFDDMNGNMLRERESALAAAKAVQNNGSIPRFPEKTPLAMAYVPYQQWSEVYNDEDAFESGTLFPDLNMPFCKGGGTL